MPKRPSGKHLSEADRCVIDQLLKEGHSIRYIAGQMECSPSTISREISSHSLKRVPRTCDCLNFRKCQRKDVCHSGQDCRKLCRACPTAKKLCPDYTTAFCEAGMENRTGVCNFCVKRGICNYTRYVYDPYKAQEQSESDLRNSRSGRNITEEHLEKINSIVSPLLKQGSPSTTSSSPMGGSWGSANPRSGAW